MDIIGAGFAGIAAAQALLKRDLTNFTLFERLDGPGGVWWASRYPGAEVDTASRMYSFSFHRYDWSRSHAGAAELRQYIADAVDTLGIGDRIRYGAHVERIVWDEDAGAWTLTVNGEPLVFEHVISAVGILNEPRRPDWPGLERFRGPCFHTSEWPEDLDLRGKRVAVVGTGSTSVQVVSTIAEVAREVVVSSVSPAGSTRRSSRNSMRHSGPGSAEDGATVSCASRGILRRPRPGRVARSIAPGPSPTTQRSSAARRTSARSWRDIPT